MKPFTGNRKHTGGWQWPYLESVLKTYPSLRKPPHNGRCLSEEWKMGVGTSVLAPVPMKVTWKGTDKYGSKTLIGRPTINVGPHKAGTVRLIFGHLSSYSRGVGQTVGVGEEIAKSGKSGRATGPHLCFTCRIGATFIDPIPFLDWQPANIGVMPILWQFKGYHGVYDENGTHILNPSEAERRYGKQWGGLIAKPHLPKALAFSVPAKREIALIKTVSDQKLLKEQKAHGKSKIEKKELAKKLADYQKEAETVTKENVTLKRTIGGLRSRITKFTSPEAQVERRAKALVDVLSVFIGLVRSLLGRLRKPS